MSDSTSSLHRILTALALLREATPAEIATQAGLGYSTVPPKLRHLQADELAMQGPDSGTGKSVRKWTLTPKGILATAVIPDTAVLSTEQMPAEQNTDGGNDENTVNVPHTDGADDHDEASEPHPDVELTSMINATVEGTPSDGRDSDIDTGPALMPATADLEAGPPPQPADTGPQPHLASPGLVTAATTGPDRQGASVAVSTSEQRPEDADTGSAEIDLAVPGESTEQVTATGPQALELATQPASAPPQDAGTGVGAADQVAEPGEAQDGEPADAEQVTKPRRRSGTLRAAVLTVLQNHPDQQFTVSQVCKAVDAANTDSDAAKASAGAVNNALLKLANDGVIQQVVEKPAAYQAV